MNRLRFKLIPINEPKNELDLPFRVDKSSSVFSFLFIEIFDLLEDPFQLYWVPKAVRCNDITVRFGSFVIQLDVVDMNLLDSYRCDAHLPRQYAYIGIVYPKKPLSKVRGIVEIVQGRSG